MGQMVALPNSDNLIGNATITVSSENASFPKANLALLPISRTFRFTGDTSENILLEFVGAVSISFVGIINHNLSQAAIITVKAGTTSAASDFSQSVTWRERAVYLLLDAAISYQYWKIEVSDPSSPAGAIEIGYISIGLATILTSSALYGTVEQFPEYVNAEDETEFGAPYVAELFSRQIIRFDLRSEDDSDFVSLLSAIKRNLLPVFLILDDDVYEGYFGRIINNPERRLFRIASAGYTESSIEFREDGMGRSIPA